MKPLRLWDVKRHQHSNMLLISELLVCSEKMDRIVYNKSLNVRQNRPQLKATVEWAPLSSTLIFCNPNYEKSLNIDYIRFC